MLQTKTDITSWGMGLSCEQAALVRETLGEEHELVLFSDSSAKDRMPPLHADMPAPHVLWLCPRSLAELRKLSDGAARRDVPAYTALLLNDDYGLGDVEDALDSGISEIIRPPLTRERIFEVMRRALEMRALHSDIDAMTREILLERELLERKNNILAFLVNFLSATTESLEIEHLLSTAFTGLGQLLPVRSMQAALWDESSSSPSLSLYIGSPQGSPAYEDWHAALLRHSALHLGNAFSLQAVAPLALNKAPGFAPDAGPRDGALLSLPLVCGKERLGVLLLLADADKPLGRDQAMALDSAIRHFSLTVKNARRFRMMQECADFDLLTRVHSRRHFEARLSEEMQRFTRYGQPFSLLMFDVDHFKRVNDTYGHHVGDVVLREIGAILNNCVRGTDYCARYGGEEFVILLPYTGRRRAMTLADRIRESIASHVFFADAALPLQVTASIGVAHISQANPKSRERLLQEADEALYAAKEEGRNRVRFAERTPLAVAQNHM